MFMGMSAYFTKIEQSTEIISLNKTIRRFYCKTKRIRSLHIVTKRAEDSFEGFIFFCLYIFIANLIQNSFILHKYIFN